MKITIKNSINIIDYDAYHDGIYFYNNYQEHIALGEILLFFSKAEKELLPSAKGSFYYTLEPTVILFYDAENKEFILNLGVEKCEKCKNKKGCYKK